MPLPYQNMPPPSPTGARGAHSRSLASKRLSAEQGLCTLARLWFASTFGGIPGNLDLTRQLQQLAAFGCAVQPHDAFQLLRCLTAMGGTDQLHSCLKRAKLDLVLRRLSQQRCSVAPNHLEGPRRLDDDGCAEAVPKRLLDRTHEREQDRRLKIIQEAEADAIKDNIALCSAVAEVAVPSLQHSRHVVDCIFRVLRRRHVSEAAIGYRVTLLAARDDTKVSLPTRDSMP
mmetsp:Transcript_114816/g.357627  ORF Transcript_114816/g.357627 Transcript_114816/m.357627 type:complete len:229 (-) Transcript_114816:594-1280(-)